MPNLFRHLTGHFACLLDAIHRVGLPGVYIANGMPNRVRHDGVNKMSCRIYFGISQDKLTIMHSGDLPGVYLAGGMPNLVRHDGNKMSCRIYFGIPQDKLTRCMASTGQAAPLQVGCRTEFGMTGIYFGIPQDKPQTVSSNHISNVPFKSFISGFSDLIKFIFQSWCQFLSCFSRAIASVIRSKYS